MLVKYLVYWTAEDFLCREMTWERFEKHLLSSCRGVSANYETRLVADNMQMEIQFDSMSTFTEQIAVLSSLNYIYHTSVCTYNSYICSVNVTF